MKPDQDLCESAAAVIEANRTTIGLPDNVQVLPRHSTVALQRPSIICATEGMQNRGSKMRQGTFLLRYLADGDDESAETSQARLNATEAWLTGGGRPVLKAAMQARGNWLRKLSATDSPVEQDGDRGRVYDQRFSTWIQTSL